MGGLRKAELATAGILRAAEPAALRMTMLFSERGAQDDKKEMAAGGAGLPQGAVPPDPGPLPPTQPAGINWRFARSRALIAAIVLALLVSLPATGPFFVIWVPLAGALCVFLYQR